MKTTNVSNPTRRCLPVEKCRVGVVCDLVCFRRLSFSNRLEILNADDKLNGLVTNAKIGVLGKYELSALVAQYHVVEGKEIEQCFLKHKHWRANSTVLRFNTLVLADSPSKKIFERCSSKCVLSASLLLSFEPKGKKKPVAFERRPIPKSPPLRQDTQEVAEITGEAGAGCQDLCRCPQ